MFVMTMHFYIFISFISHNSHAFRMPYTENTQIIQVTLPDQVSQQQRQGLSSGLLSLSSSLLHQDDNIDFLSFQFTLDSLVGFTSPKPLRRIEEACSL
jgi:hypothetical protein